jgi:hypothetical protein
MWDESGRIEEGIVPLFLSRDSQTNSASNTKYAKNQEQ